MFLRMRFVAGLALLSLGLCGCFTSGDSAQDEERNPYFLAGKERVAARDYKGAIEAFEKALEVNPRSALAHYELGVLYEQRENDYPAAIHHYNKVLKLRPDGSYPAENAKLRIPGCKNEMVKLDTLTTINPAALLELERLREENQKWQKLAEEQRRQIEALHAWVNAARAVMQQQQQPPTQTAPPAMAPAANTGNPPAGGTRSPATARAPATANTPATARKHVVQSGETLTSIAQRYGVRLEALRAANPGVNERRIRAGQAINLP